MGIEGASRVSEININMNQRKVCQHPFLFGEPKDKMTGEFVGVKNPEVRESKVKRKSFRRGEELLLFLFISAIHTMKLCGVALRW